jgi:holo-[acyl-carrier protein] synthase
MKVFRLGLDLVDVERIRLMLEKHGERFTNRTFTHAECEYCNGSVTAPLHFAARFAAKEAAAKALGTGFAQGISWKDIEVLREPSGEPVLLLHGAAAERAAALGVQQSFVSLTHTAQSAAASVVLIG